MNEFKEKPNFDTNEDLARLFIENKRQVAKKSPDPTVYQTEIINGPMVPSEAFLVLEGAFFPTLQLKEQLAEVEGGKYKKYTEASFKGHISFNEKNEPEFYTEQDILPIRKFPLNRNDDKRGCIEIWIKPQRNSEGVIPRGTYIAGIDVVDKDKSTTDSLPCIMVMNRYTRQIVAEYTGRTSEAKDFYEVCRKLLLYYNAIGMYEKNLIGLYNHFDQHKCTYLLAETPYQLRSAGILSPNSFNCFSVWKIILSAWFNFSTLSLSALSEASFALASAFIFSISSLLKPLPASILIFCSLPVPLSFALTFKIPFASISNVTSI